MKLVLTACSLMMFSPVMGMLASIYLGGGNTLGIWQCGVLYGSAIGMLVTRLDLREVGR